MKELFSNSYLQMLNRFVSFKANFLATSICPSCSVWLLKVKCESYIPESVSFYGDVKVTVESTSDGASYVMRHLSLEVRRCLLPFVAFHAFINDV